MRDRGVGFYGPPIYMQTVMDRTGWPIAQLSTAVTLLGSIVLSSGVNTWAQANQLWVLYAGAVCSGIGCAAASEFGFQRRWILLEHHQSQAFEAMPVTLRRS